MQQLKHIAGERPLNQRGDSSCNKVQRAGAVCLKRAVLPAPGAPLGFACCIHHSSSSASSSSRERKSASELKIKAGE
jgi:hypothetical protein